MNSIFVPIKNGVLTNTVLFLYFYFRAILKTRKVLFSEKDFDRLWFLCKTYSGQKKFP